MKYQIKENDSVKLFRSEIYNYNFDKRTGFFQRWGITESDDPDFSPFGCEILDLEITTSCNGINGVLCHECYKANTPKGKNMSADTFKLILDKMPKTLTQIAFGADSECKSNPNIWKMCEYAKSKGIITNITVANIDDSTADMLVKTMGAVAVSRYEDKNVCYDSVKRLTDRGLKQTNIHILLSKESLDQVYETINDYINGDERLEKLNAIVILSLKKKGRGINHNIVSYEEFSKLMNYALDNNVPCGFDSCGADKFYNSIQSRDNWKEMWQLAEPCESFAMFSSYINVDGFYFPCSFCESSHSDFMQGFDVVNCSDFLTDIWHNDLLIKWRNRMIERRKNNDFSCPIFKV